MNIKPIRNQKAYRAALRELDRLITVNPAPGTTADGDLELLALVLEDYERKKFPATPPDPIEAIKFRLEQEGKTEKDLEPLLGGKERVRAILARKRPLTLRMIRTLHGQLGISAEVLITEAA